MVMAPSVIVSVGVAMAFLATVAIAATPPYKCFPFNNGGNGKRSHDKSGTRQLRKREELPCPGPGCAAIEPMGDIVREVGTPYEAYCLFDPAYVNVANVAFFHRSAERNFEIAHEVVNASAIRVEVTHNTSDDYKLFCTINSQHLCTRSVKIGYPPQDVKNFSCISKNWSELNCSWTIPDNPVTVNYHLTYVVPGFREQSECPTRYLLLNYCIWPKDRFGLIVQEIWVIQFNATNRIKREGVQYNHSINIYESVLPDPVIQLKGTVDGPWNVTLSWILPHPIGTLPAVVFEVAYRDRHEGDVSEEVPWEVVDQWKAKPDAWDPNEVFNKTVNGLRPYGEYDFRVRIHTGFGEIRPHMWSDAVILTLRTDAIRPTVAPLTTLGTFEVEETLKFRDIFVSWQKIDQRAWNGPELHYVVQAYDDSTNMLTEKPPEDVDIKETYAKFINMDKDITYRFEIIPVNREGPPEVDDVKAVVRVPDHLSILKQAPFFKVIAYSGPKETIYSMRWRIDEEEIHKIESVTLYWCKKNKYEERCLNKLEWEIVSDLSVNVKNITGLDELPLYLFGISVNSKTSSSGIKWITCIASYGNRPPPLEQFEASVVSSKEIHLQWGLDCKAKAAEPRGFNISYCINTEQSLNCPTDANMTYIHVSDETAEEYVVGNLQPYTTYIFNIAILTEIGPSKWSKSEQARTRADKPSGPPQDFKVVESGPTWILLSWQPPMISERNGDISKYILTTEPMIAQKDVLANATSDYTQYNVTSLEYYTNYKFSIIACTKGLNTIYCGNDHAVTVEKRTKIGVPSKIEDIYQIDQFLKWEHECLNGPSCLYQLNYTINETAYSHLTDPSAAALNIKDFNLTCTEEKKQIVISLCAVTYDENNQLLYGPAKEEKVTCYLPVLEWWTITLICAICIVIIIVILVVGRYGWGRIKLFLMELKRKPVLPPGMEDIEPNPNRRTKKPHYGEYLAQIPRDSIIDEKPPRSAFSVISNASEEQECQDLIPPGGERGGRNLSGDSGTSEVDPGDSSGCSTGGESDSSSASERVHQSSDSGTVQEEPGFHMDGNKWGGSGSLRLRTTGPPYVRQGLPNGINGVDYVPSGSVPNLMVGITEGGQSQAFAPHPPLSTLPEMPIGTRTSTGYFSMLDLDSDGISLDVLSNLTLPHEGRQSGFPAYSRHNFPYKKTSPEFSPYTKTGSLPWLNTGYVAVAQAEGGAREAFPHHHGYVAVSDAMGAMKRQPSLPSMPTSFSKSLSTPDEEFPPGAYCRVGSRTSPGPPAAASPGYVGITQAIPLQTAPSSLTTSTPTNKSPYVTCAIAESMVSPTSTPGKGGGGYVSVGDLSGGRWAHAVPHPHSSDESREVSSAPVEGSRGRPSIPTRPSTSDAVVNHNRGGTRWPPLAPSLSKQSSGYVSQEALTSHDPVVMSPKRLLAQSHEPHSVVLSANHKASMV